MFSVCNNCGIKSSKIGKHPERISIIKPFIDTYNWKGIDLQAGIKDWKHFEENNKEITLNILYFHIIQKQ